MEVSHLETKERTNMQQFRFCESLLEQVKKGDTILLLPLSNIQAFNSEGIVNLLGFCVACGEPFAAPDVLCVYTLACGHQYHPLCFAHWVGAEKLCAHASCNRSVPDSAQSMLVHTGMLYMLDKTQVMICCMVLKSCNFY